MEMVRMSSDLRLKKDVELSQANYLKFHSVFNDLLIRFGPVCGPNQVRQNVGIVHFSFP